MTLHFLWFISTAGNGERIELRWPERAPDLDPIVDVIIIRAAERSGVGGLLASDGAQRSIRSGSYREEEKRVGRTLLPLFAGRKSGLKARLAERSGLPV